LTKFHKLYYKKIVFLVLTCSQLESFHPFEDFLKDFLDKLECCIVRYVGLLLPVAKMELFLGDGKWFVEEGGEAKATSFLYWVSS
jgi:hypothetical protein